MNDLGALYIDLLERVLVNSIYRDPSIAPWNAGRYVHADRQMGRDWPMQAMTMIGAMRLRNLRDLCVDVIRREVPGDFIETGVWRGGAAILMRAIDKAAGGKRCVFVADSFAGLPPPDPRFPADAGDTHHTMAQLAVSRAEVEENFRKFGLLDDQVVFLEGWFADTLPTAPIDKLAILRLDGDMYGSTWTALEALYAKLSDGGFCIVDDYGAVEGCRRATDDYRAEHHITDEIRPIDGLGVYWKKETQ